jgi:hypothetical protein
MGVIRWLGSLLAWAFSLVLFLLMPWRWFRRQPASVTASAAMTVDAPEMAADEPEAGWPQMPRIGKPGTATDDQVEALMDARFVPAPPCRDLHDYSTEEAAAILDAVAFARAVARQVTGGEDEGAPPEVLTALLNDIVATTLADQALRDLALRWARGGQVTPIRENTTFALVREAVLRHWQPSENA